MITSQELKKHIVYDKESGTFARVRNGKPAGGIDKDGYLVIRVGKKICKAHRLAWLYVTGLWPSHTIDHINGIKTDNKINNLREATDAQNKQNWTRKNKTNKSGFLGVSYCKRDKKYIAAISINGKTRRIGYFMTPEEASTAYLLMKRKHHEFCTI
jgi:hypothetical protein